MSNSSLVNLFIPAYTGNYTKGRSGKKIEEITIHHMAARWTAQRCGESFQAPGREGSSHYGIGYDGEIAQYVDEADTAWTNSNWDANCRAVTIETANSQNGGNWPVSDASLNSLIKLVADIAKRNGLIPLIKGKNLTWHQMYAATACPGPYLISKLDYIVDEVNKIITNGSNIITNITPVNITYQVYTNRWLGDINQHNANDPNNGYAGIFGNPITGVYIDASVGNVYYQAHIKGGNWLPEVKNREDYAGIFGKPIDGIMIKSDSTTIHYQVHTAEDGWLGEVTGYDQNDHNYGYAGWQGHSIDGLMVWADDIVITTVIETPKQETPTETITAELYRIRTTWNDSKSQIGAYKNLDSAIKICQEKTEATNTIYKVFDSAGNVKYEGILKVPEEVKPDITEPIPQEPEVITPIPVYELDYPDKVLIIDNSIKRAEIDCVKVIKSIKANNNNFDENIAKAFFILSPIYGIDPVIAIAQSILETGWFKYEGSAVSPDHHNYCGLGVTVNGKPGNIFNSIEDGVRAQLQHLFAYGSVEELPEGEILLDERFKYVTRGIAPFWQQLAGRWAVPGYDKNTYVIPYDAMVAENTYGQKILKIAVSILDIEVNEEDMDKYFPKEEIKKPETIEKEPNNNIDDIINNDDSTNAIFNLIKKIIFYIINLFKNKGE